MVKEFLSQRGIGFEERDVSLNPSAAQELIRSTGQMGVPVITIDVLNLIPSIVLGAPGGIFSSVNNRF